jgi:Type II secretion system (T2SS), protein E, N-terminal domain
MSLSSLIVQREIASIREIEEALARQVLYGGDFVTNLFEVSRVEEAALMPVVAESFGLPVAPTGELPKIPEIATRLVAAEVVAQRAFAPLEFGTALVVAVAEPLSRDAEQELTFALALPIEQRIAPLFRIRQALARDYGLPLDKRTSRLITKIVHNGPRIASTFPPPFESSPLQRTAPRPPSFAPPPAPRSPLSLDAPRTPATTRGTFVRKVEAPPARPARRRRGPLTADVAKSELEASAERDVIFDVLFEFARQFFDYTALFIVHGDLAEGRDAFGDGAARDKVARVGVPLDLRNILAMARETKRLVRARPSKEGLDPVLMADLGRDGTTECVVFPIVVRTRVVALLFGDGGTSGIDDVGVGQVLSLVTAASGAFERVIMRRKLKGEGADAGAEGGALNAKNKAADSVPPPPTQVSTPPQAGGSDRPSVEELAPPIRDLMTEPVSHAVPTPREPSATAALLGADPLSVRSDRPPPANLLAVRKLSGRPIPREEPESARLTERAGSPSTPPRTPSGPPARTRSQSLKRAEAPRLEFGTPSMPSVSAEGASWGFGSPTAHDTERQLIAQIEGKSSAEPPQTPRDGGAWSDRDPSTPPQVHAWAPAPAAPRGRPSSSPNNSASRALDATIHSPAAESPPPMRVAAPITDMSPQPLSVEATPSVELRAQPFVRQITVSDDTPPRATPILTPAHSPAPPPVASPANFTTTLVAGSPLLPTVEPPLEPPVDPSTEPVLEGNLTAVIPLVVVTPDREMKPVPLASVMEAADRDVDGDWDRDLGFDPDATPVVPPVFDSEAGVSGGVFELRPSQAVEPVLSLAQRKGAPPVLPPVESKPMPMSEQQVSVPAHRPPSSRSDHSRILPSVIVDVASEYVTLVDRVLAGPDEDAETDLLRAGGYAMPAIMAKFPGPILIEPERLEGNQLPRVAECGPVIRLVASQRRTALPFVLAHVEGSDPDLRFWATYLLTELVYPDAIDAAVARALDESSRVRRAARAAVRALAEAHPQPVVERLGEIAKTQSVLRRVQAVDALGETREPLAVAVLLSLLEDDADAVVTAARAALVLIAQQDFGRDRERWQTWWSANRHRHRIEWLIDALMHDQRALRGSASDELRTITKEYFAYYDDLPKRERERAQARYREWWENIGRVRFSRASTRGA